MDKYIFNDKIHNIGSLLSNSGILDNVNISKSAIRSKKELKWEARELVAELFEQILLFEKVTFKAYTPNIIGRLIETMGLDQFELSIRNNLLSPIIYPFGIMLNSKKHQLISTKGESIGSMFDNFGILYNAQIDKMDDKEYFFDEALKEVNISIDRNRRRALKRNLIKKTKIFEAEKGEEAIKLAISAYTEGKFSEFGLVNDVDINEIPWETRKLFRRITVKILDLMLISENNFGAYEDKVSMILSKDSLANIAEAKANFNKTESLKETIYKVFKMDEIPNFQKLYLEGKIDFYSAIKIREKGTSEKFRKWIRDATESDKSIGKEYLNEIQKTNTFLETIGGKCFKTLLIFGAGIGVGLATQNPFLGLSANLGLGVFDNFILEKFDSGWNPRIFTSEIEKIIDE